MYEYLTVSLSSFETGNLSKQLSLYILIGQPDLDFLPEQL